MYEVKIKKAMNGYIVEVGCQTLVFETEGKLINELTRYLNNPGKVEKEYQELYGEKTESPQRGGVVGHMTLTNPYAPAKSEPVPEPRQDIEESPEQSEIRVRLQSVPPD